MDAKALAQQVVESLLGLTAMPTAPTDPILDHPAAIIERGLHVAGFPSELIKQAAAVGLELRPEVQAVLITAAARACSRVTH